MKIDLSGKSALVTGSSKGIGFAIARNFIDAGAKVSLNGRSKESVETALQKLRSEFPKANLVGVIADLQKKEEAEKLYKEVPQVDILVNNLGIFETKPFFEISDEEWQRFFDVNVMSAIRMSRHYTPGMVHRKWGRVMFMSSESAIQIPKEIVHYGMTKTALLSISRGLAETVSASGVTVNAIMPGPTLTEGVEIFTRSIARTPTKASLSSKRNFLKLHAPPPSSNVS